MSKIKIFSTAAVAIALFLNGCGGDTSPEPVATAAINTIEKPQAAADSFSQNGWYWNPDESGTGFFFEAQGDAGFAGFFVYEPGTGKPTWLAASGTFTRQSNGFTFIGPLLKYQGGQPASSATYRAPTSIAQGQVQIQFSGNTATAYLPGRVWSAVRFDFAGIGTPAASGQPETGWFWNPAEGGRGYASEVQNNQIFLVMFHYDWDGSPTWNTVQGDISKGTLKADFNAYSGGQTLNGPYVKPGNPKSAGAFSMSFAGPCYGQIGLAGSPVVVQRFTIGAEVGRECRAITSPTLDKASAKPPELLELKSASTQVSKGVPYVVNFDASDDDSDLAEVSITWTDPTGSRSAETKSISGKTANLTFSKAFTAPGVVNWEAVAIDARGLSSETLKGSFSVGGGESTLVQCTGEGAVKFAVGQSEKLACPVGQSSSSERSRTCQTNGTWTPITGTCAPQITAQQCTGKDGKSYSTGAAEVVACSVGQTGSQSRVCGEGGAWGDLAGVCAAPPTPTALTCIGTFGQTFPSGATEQMSCPLGQTGIQSRVCSSTGSWGSLSGQCIAAQCTGLAGKTFSAGETEQQNCPSGQIGSQTRTCGSSGSWGQLSGTCQAQAASCLGLNGAKYLIGQNETIACAVGLSGGQSRQCLSGGWGGVTGSCQLVSTAPTLNSAAKTGNLRTIRCPSGASGCVQAGITLSGSGFNGFSSVRLTWSGPSSASYNFTAGTNLITNATDTSIDLWPIVFDQTDPVGRCYEWSASVTKGQSTSQTKTLVTGNICRPSGV